MGKTALLLLALLAPTLPAPTPAWGAPNAWPAAPAALEMQPVSELDQDSSQPQLGNGIPAEPSDWPASFFASKRGETDPSCTATLIGARSLLTAAHCIASGGRVTITLAGRRYAGTCEDVPHGYPEVRSRDWAMCLMDGSVPAAWFERVNLQGDALRRGDRITLAGYGCTSVGGAIDGRFRYGPAFVDQPWGSLPDDPQFLATAAGASRGDAFICSGDSGGAVFLEPPGLVRSVIAVNSHFDQSGNGASYLAVLSASDGGRFLRDWADRHGQRLCGMDSDAQNCRRF